ncbi:hypothetical protein ACFQ6N_29995 [Kitasatospora sp. NPDC056446]|uniref:DUF7683 domain-containing protein n=1 Tax=Kitasatospora sp. NPDC056446 TaxID=3345819 RepID=UPI00368DF5B6
MIFLISAYRKGADFPESEIDVTDLGGEFLAGLFGIPLREFSDVHPIGEGHAEAISRRSGVTFDLASRDYFLEVEAD